MNQIEILLSAHARTTQAKIVHLVDQRAAELTTCKRLCGTLWRFVARQ